MEQRDFLVLSVKDPFGAFFKRAKASLILHCCVAPGICFNLTFIISTENCANLSLFWDSFVVPETKMSQFKISEEWMLPLRSLNVALGIRLVGRLMGGTIRQVAEIILPRSSGRPPPLLPSLDINGRGSSARLVVFFDVKHQYY